MILAEPEIRTQILPFGTLRSTLIVAGGDATAEPAGVAEVRVLKGTTAQEVVSTVELDEPSDEE